MPLEIEALFGLQDNLSSLELTPDVFTPTKLLKNRSVSTESVLQKPLEIFNLEDFPNKSYPQ